MGTVDSIWKVLLIGVAGVLVIAGVVALTVWIVMPLGRGLGAFGRHVWRFIAGEFKDAGRLVACIIVAPIFAALALLSLIFFQRDSAARFGRALREEGLRIVVSIYRIFVGHPARLLGLETALEGIETRLPTVLTTTWGDAVSPRQGLFPGYTILRTLPGGGSGAKLYVAEPDKRRLKELVREGFPASGAQVVIKSFTTYENDGLLTIVRESRALDAGRRMGLILEHTLTPERFYYVMRFVPGDSLRVVTSRLHNAAGDAGLDEARLRTGLGYIRDLLDTLRQYHDNGLWHKDVKPDNVIVETFATPAANDSLESLKKSPLPGAHPGRATLVDFGLVSSLRSAMTLTTHGTEYFRDPEMVRRALRGVKVHEVDGVRFDIYAAGAVMYAMIEDSFPAQGVLSPIKKRCPESVSWIIRRAMADYDQRYDSVQAMLHDLETVLTAADLFTLRPIDLPSMGAPIPAPAVPPAPARELQAIPPDLQGPDEGTNAGLSSATVEPAMSANKAGRSRSIIRVRNWWTGRSEVVGALPDSREEQAKSPAA